MRGLLLVIGLLLVVGRSLALPDELSGGCLITHYCEALGFSHDPPALGWCEEYMTHHAIGDHSEQVNRIDATTDLAASWLVLAAWTEEKIWCGNEVGLGSFDERLFVFLEWSTCFPDHEGLELCTSGWPGPNEGIACVAAGTPWQGNYIPLVWFGGYVYGAEGCGVIPLAVDPPTGFAGFSNCAVQPMAFEVASERLGGLGINTPGHHVKPVPYSHPTGICCVGEECLEITERECWLMEGDWLGEELVCEPWTCSPEGSCCLPEPIGACQHMCRHWCRQVHGVWFEALGCPPHLCFRDRVCCLEGGTCIIVKSQMQCEIQGGELYPQWSSCDPNPCPRTTPIRGVSWGQLKALYHLEGTLAAR